MKRLLAILFTLCLSAGEAVAAYPERPVTLIVPLPAGGPSDAVARAVAEVLARQLGQPVVVENKPGADGTVGVRAALSGAADGHVLLYGIGSVVALPHLQSPAPFDVARDLKPVGMIGRFPFMMSVHPSVPAKTVEDFIAYARTRPQPLFYASSTPAETLAAVEFMKATGVRMARVPYKGSAQAIPDLLGGRVQVMFGPLAAVLQPAQNEQLRLLAVLAPGRIAAAPDVPTLAEAGVAGVALPTWQAIFAPAGTPQAAIDRLATALAAALALPELRERLARTNLHVESEMPAALAERIRAEDRLWATFVRETELKAQ